MTQYGADKRFEIIRKITRTKAYDYLEMNTVADNLYSRCRKLRIQVITARDNSPLPPLV
jgi:NAD-specific glutamate dehydrogenase